MGGRKREGASDGYEFLFALPSRFIPLSVTTLPLYTPYNILHLVREMF
jgi:hypothetical protein